MLDECFGGPFPLSYAGRFTLNTYYFRNHTIKRGPAAALLRRGLVERYDTTLATSDSSVSQ